MVLFRDKMEQQNHIRKEDAMKEPAKPKGAILQRDKETYAIVPRIPVGLATAENLKDIVKVVEKYSIPIIKITSGQRLALVGMKGEVVDAVWKDLQMDVGKATELCLHYVQACPGNAVCKFGVQDSLGLGIEIEDFFLGMDLPAKVKIGISGCPFCCAESFVRDIGMFGKKNGWTVIFGGNSARRPRVGDIIAEDIEKDAALALARKCLEYYAAQGKNKERTARFIERIGIDEFKKAVCS
jgi:NAD(P)H-nitrite reductase large subunit